MTVLTSTSHISHKRLIVVWWREASKTSMLFAIKMMMLTMVTMIVLIMVMMVLVTVMMVLMM
eukprot:7883684-Ditylum_brightwellii.AAC.1